MKVLLLFVLLGASLCADSLEALIRQAYNSDPTLTMLHEEASVMQEEVGLSGI